MSDHRPLTPSTTVTTTTATATTARVAATPPDGSEPPAVRNGAPDVLAGLLAAAGIGFHVVYEGPARRCPAGHRRTRWAA